MMGVESEAMLACAAMQALTTLAGHASARLAVLRDRSLLPNLTQRLGPGGPPVTVVQCNLALKNGKDWTLRCSLAC